MVRYFAEILMTGPGRQSDSSMQHVSCHVRSDLFTSSSRLTSLIVDEEPGFNCAHSVNCDAQICLYRCLSSFSPRITVMRSTICCISEEKELGTTSLALVTASVTSRMITAR